MTRNRVLAFAAGVLVLAGPRRTRPLAGFLYGVGLSRAHGASRRHLEATIRHLFDARESALARIDVLEQRLERAGDVVIGFDAARRRDAAAIVPAPEEPPS